MLDLIYQIIVLRKSYMHNFTFYNPVKIFFGSGQISQLTKLDKSSKILITYGGGSVKQNGILEQTKSQLHEFTYYEFGGIEPNPEYETLIKAIDICREKKITFILAVGGGSVIDASKFIAIAANYSGEAWDIMTTSPKLTSAIDLGVVLTMPATGSEMNCFSVISRRKLNAKLALNNPLVFPKFAILDPEFTYSLPTRQLLNGIIDPFIHVTEQYLTTNLNTPIQDGFAEAILKTLIEIAPAISSGSTDYNTRANWMWACSNALNGYIGVGVDQDWATHAIGHELTAIYNLDHAQTLAIIAPQLWRHQLQYKRDKLVKMAKNVWKIDHPNQDTLAEMSIARTEQFFHSLGVKTKLSNYDIVVDSELLTKNLFSHQTDNLGELKNIDKAAVIEILAMAK